MVTLLYQIGAAVSGWYYGNPDPLEIVPTPDNLKRAIQEKGKDVLICKFRDARAYCPSTYTPLEYAVSIGDIEAARALIGFGANVNYSSRSGMGTIVHYYIDCLTENDQPNLAILTLLLDSISDVNAEENGYFLTPLEYALQHMVRFKNIHWGMIDFFLTRGARITSVNGTTPFTVLRDSHLNMKSAKDEEKLLTHLVDYLELERRHHPESDSTLSMEEFQAFTFHFRNENFSKAALALSGTAAGGLFHLSSGDISEIIKEIPDESGREEAQKKVDEFTTQQSQHQRQLCLLVCQALLKYHRFFETLVKEGSFRACFDGWELAAIMPMIQEQKSLQPQIILFKRWALVEKSTD